MESFSELGTGIQSWSWNLDWNLKYLAIRKMLMLRNTGADMRVHGYSELTGMLTAPIGIRSPSNILCIMLDFLVYLHPPAWSEINTAVDPITLWTCLNYAEALLLLLAHVSAIHLSAAALKNGCPSNSRGWVLPAVMMDLPYVALSIFSAQSAPFTWTFSTIQVQLEPDIRIPPSGVDQKSQEFFLAPAQVIGEPWKHHLWLARLRPVSNP